MVNVENTAKYVKKIKQNKKKSDAWIYMKVYFILIFTVIFGFKYHVYNELFNFVSRCNKIFGKFKDK